MSAPTHHLSHVVAAAPAPGPLSSILQKELVASFANSCKEYLDPTDPSMITAADRMALVDWCYNIVDSCQCPRDTVAMTMGMVDAFLSMPSSTADAARASDEALHNQHKFQLLTIAALYCSVKAAKSDVVIPIDLFGGLYTKEEIETMERTLLSGSSSWRLAPAVTAYEVGRTILSFLLPYTNLPEATWGFFLDEVKYQTEHAVRDYYFSTQRTSTVALAALFDAVKCLSSKAHQDMLSNALTRVVDRFDFDDSKVIFVARQRLQSLVDGKLVAHEPPMTGLSLDDSLKSLDDISAYGGDEDSINDVDFNDFLNTFVPECDRRMPVMPTKEDVDAAAATAVATPPRKRVRTARTNPHLDRTKPSKKSMPTVSSNTHQSAPPPPPITPIQGADEANIPTKPMRPLTAYHIYLQIEKEFIVQTMDGDEADKSMHDNKVYLDYVPERYRQIKLSPDWYFGPGKRQTKRKHRKGHGKVGFQELSRMIASRWAKLEETNPDIKRFVKKIADQELAEYRRDMAVYNRYMKNHGLSSKPVVSTTKSNSKSKNMTKKRKHQESEQSSRKEKEEGATTVSPCPLQLRRVSSVSSSHHLVTPNSSVLHLSHMQGVERQASPVLGNELKGFSYFPSRKRSMSSSCASR